MESLRLTIKQHSKPGELGNFSYHFPSPSGPLCSGYDYATETDAQRYGLAAIRAIPSYRDIGVEVIYETAAQKQPVAPARKLCESKWCVFEYSEFSTHIHTQNGQLVALVIGDNKAQKMERAHLIAAAPELLAALEACIPHILHYAAMPHASPEAHKDAANARAAIRKATGQQ